MDTAVAAGVRTRARSTARGRQVWLHAVATEAKRLSAALYGEPWDACSTRATTREMDVIGACAFSRVPRYHRTSGTCVQFRIHVARQMGFDRYAGSRRTCSLSQELRDLRPTFQPRVPRRGPGVAHAIFVLDLCCGTKPFDRAVEEYELTKIHVVTVDVDPQRKPTWCEDVTRWRQWLPERLVEMRRR